MSKDDESKVTKMRKNWAYYIDKHKCWECGKKAKWQRHFYHVSKGFHSKVYFCNSEKCYNQFYARNEGILTQTASYHIVN